ncbi:MAG: hypothetical protein JNK26_02330 [Candidatus Doudnabacteria bacterium]|nr:hypothetical protein [Candidatus Doudnabacteria bacterium]
MQQHLQRNLELRDSETVGVSDFSTIYDLYMQQVQGLVKLGFSLTSDAYSIGHLFIASLLTKWQKTGNIEKTIAVSVLVGLIIFVLFVLYVNNSLNIDLGSLDAIELQYGPES